MSIGIGFKPIQGKSDDVLNATFSEGNLYFCTDTGKMYLDTITSDGDVINKMPIGGSGAALLYGYQATVEDGPNGYTIDLGNLDEGIAPKPGDLILNSDGGFYKVVYTDEVAAYCEQLAVSGSGGTGGGGGPGGGGGTTGTARMDRITQSPVTVLYGGACPISFNVYAADSSGEQTGDGTGQIVVGSSVKASFVVHQGENTVDVGPYLILGSNTVTIRVSISTGGFANANLSKGWNVTTTSLGVSWDYDETQRASASEPLNLRWNMTGAVSKTTHIIIDNVLEPEIPATTGTTGTYQLNPLEFNLGHGAHKFEMYVTALIGGVTIRTDSIFKSIIFVDENNKTPIISCSLFDTTAQQYDTVKIPLVIYDPNAITTGITRVTLKENSETKDIWSDYENGTRAYWNYTPMVSGVRYLTISCGNSELNLSLDVAHLDINNEEVGGYKFKFKATDFASNNAITAWNSNDVTLTLSDNFDWINGGLKSEGLLNGKWIDLEEIDEKEQSSVSETRQFVRVRAGTTLTINYQLFKTDISTNHGKSLKIIYKATNCRDYHAVVLRCHDSSNNVGVRINAQNALFTSASNSVDSPLCEDYYTEFEVDITKKDMATTRAKNYIVPWINGVPSGVSVFTTSDSFKQNNVQSLTFGSDDCDVDIYLVKAYEDSLTNDEHLQNFIADAPNATEMLARYNRNDILDDNGEISYSKLSEKNPNVAVHIMDIPHVPLDKKKDIVPCQYEQYKNGQLVISAENALLKPQGTSSMAYGLAAYNFDLDVSKKKGAVLKDHNGDVIEKWSMDDDAIPVSYFNFKANVASCEGANNALNQEWYNRFQPYICNHRKNHPGIEPHDKARDTMQFKPGVIFLIDRNQVTNVNGNGDNVFKDTPGYLQNPYAKMYSISCMGNSKKNIDVFHDQTNPEECCIEVSDNQEPQQWMTRYDNLTYDGEGLWEITLVDPDGQPIVNEDGEVSKTDAYEFRYPDGGGTAENVAAWEAFIKWMAESDVCQYDKVNHPFGYHVFEGDGSGLDTEIWGLHTDGKYYHWLKDAEGHKTQIDFTPVTIKWKDNHNGSLPNTSISEYARSYTLDTEDYRVAKMLRECQDHFVMDSIVYHYLFIERHSMLDNVAKNTFWSTEDNQHWQLIKDYDNDTADGIDNSGHLTLTYGKEPTDRTEDGSAMLFNASNSIWFNFAHHLYEACKAMFGYLETTGAWKSSDYLAAFDEFQSVIPERVWIQDYYRKYFRPWEVYSNTDFFAMLAGGLKTLQRTQYETYQELYMASKYASPLCTSNRIDFRANAKNEDGTGFDLPVQMYADCYIQTAFGEGSQPNTSTRMRVKRGETVTIHTSKNDFNDATCYLFMPQLYQEIGDMTIFNVKRFSASGATKLRSLILGSSTGGYTNTLLNSDIDLSANKMLEYLTVQGFALSNTADSDSVGTGRELNLSAQKNLIRVDARYSNFTGVTCADGSVVQEIYLEAPTSLTFSNLSKLKTLSINNKTKINQLDLNNIDNPYVSTKELVKSATGLLRYRLRGIKWIIDSPAEVIVNEGGIATDLVLLKKLLACDTVTNSATGESYGAPASLTGNITITQSAYNARPNTLYDKYAAPGVYPNVDFIFEGENAQMFNVKLYDTMDDKIYWQRKIMKGNQITSDFLSAGPMGAFDPTQVAKAPTLGETYVFNNMWKMYVNDNFDEIVQWVEGETPIVNLSGGVTQNITLVPDFSVMPRVHEIKFMNADNTTVGFSKFIVYNSEIGEVSFIPYQDDSGLPYNVRKAFKGWSLLKNGNINSIIDVEHYRITNTMTLYPVFVEENCLMVATDDKYFHWSPTYAGDGITQNGWSLTAGTVMDPAAGEIAWPYRGKITIPAKKKAADGNTYYVKEVRCLQIGGLYTGFMNNLSLTHVFFQNGNQIESILEHTFEGCANLEYVNIPETIKSIHNRAFIQCSSLVLDNDAFNKPYLTYIGEVAFAGGISIKTNPDNAVPILPFSASIEQIGSHAFNTLKVTPANSNVTIQFGDETHPSALTFVGLTEDGNGPFASPPITDILIYGSVSEDVVNRLRSPSSNPGIGTESNPSINVSTN